MLFELLRIRFIQIGRELRKIGVIRSLVLIFIVFLAVSVFLFQRMGFSPYNYLIMTAIGGGICFVHTRRKDFTFLFHIVTYPRLLCFAEYCVFTLIVPVALFYWGYYLLLSLYPLILYGISRIPPQSSRSHVYLNMLKYIPAHLFEWKSGVRKNLWVVVFACCLGIGGVFSFWMSMISFLLLTLVFVSFYAECENWNLLGADEPDAGNFLRKKLWLHVKCFAVLLFPFLLFSLVHAEYWIYSLSAYLCALNVLVFAIVLKYSFYRPATYTPFHQFVALFVCLFAVLLPLGLFILLINAILYNKALRNLKYYLYAYN